jgi:hypothetical protein
MSSVGNWTKRAEKQPYCAGKRSQHTCDRAPGERAPSTYERALGKRSPILQTCALELHLTWQARWTT